MTSGHRQLSAASPLLGGLANCRFLPCAPAAGARAYALPPPTDSPMNTTIKASNCRVDMRPVMVPLRSSRFDHLRPCEVPPSKKLARAINERKHPFLLLAHLNYGNDCRPRLAIEKTAGMCGPWTFPHRLRPRMPTEPTGGERFAEPVARTDPSTWPPQRQRAPARDPAGPRARGDDRAAHPCGNGRSPDQGPGGRAPGRHAGRTLLLLGD
jgi:hypothetical protein